MWIASLRAVTDLPIFVLLRRRTAGGAKIRKDIQKPLRSREIFVHGAASRPFCFSIVY
jgi:hypothetical protein